MTSTLPDLDWIYGTWQVSMSINISPKLFPSVAKNFNDDYTLNICIWNAQTYYLKLFSKSHGNLDWFGPYTIGTPITTLSRDTKGIITVDASSITAPKLPPSVTWPLTNIGQNDLISYNVLINTNNPNTDKNGRRLGILFHVDGFSQAFYGIKGCQTDDTGNPYAGCKPVNNLAGAPYIFPPIADVPALCPIEDTFPSCSINLPTSISAIVIATGVGIVAFIVIIIVLSILLAQASNKVKTLQFDASNLRRVQ